MKILSKFDSIIQSNNLFEKIEFDIDLDINNDDIRNKINKLL
jgi:hypothetical protein